MLPLFFSFQSQTPPSRRGPRRRLHPGGRSAGSSPGSVPGSRRVTEGGKSKQLSITLANSVRHHLTPVAETVSDLHKAPLGYFFWHPFLLREILSVEPVTNSDALVHTDGIPKSHPHAGWASNKNFTSPDELELQSILGKLSHHALDKQGDNDSLSSYTSGPSSNFFFKIILSPQCLYLTFLFLVTCLVYHFSLFNRAILLSHCVTMPFSLMLLHSSW